MLGKLVKHDFKATSRLYIPVIIGFIAMCVVNKISFEMGIANTINNTVIQIVASSLLLFYILAAVALAFVTQIFIAMDFYKSMTGNEGYLTHTLPVKVHTLINSKLIIAVIWQIITTILIILSVMLLVSGHLDPEMLKEIADGFKSLPELIPGISYPKIAAEIIFSIIIGLFYTPLMYYASIAIGHLFIKHRLGASIIAFFTIYFVIQMISSVVGGIYGVYFTVNSNDFTLFWKYFHILMTSTIFASFLISLAFYFGTHFIFKKKLNLQ